MDIARISIAPACSLRDALSCINAQGGAGIALVVDDSGSLLGTVTDGDVRRAVLSGFDLDEKVSAVLDKIGEKPRHAPITMPVGTPESDVLQRMLQESIRHMPLMDEGGVVKDVALLSELAKEFEPPHQAVIMAGGFGQRLLPLTESTPKPMLKVGDRPILEHVVENLRDAGIRNMNIITHYLAEEISQHFGDGQSFDVDINYVHEHEPLGTAGGLSLLENKDEPLLVVNADILTQVDFRSMLHFHRDHNADLTVAVRKYDVEVPYGVVDCKGVNVQRLQEKPVYNFFVNAGMYILQPSIFDYVPQQRTDMTEVIDTVIQNNGSVVSFPVVESWLDIGSHENFEQAQRNADQKENKK